jgi:hypothetical protein
MSLNYIQLSYLILNKIYKKLQGNKLTRDIVSFILIQNHIFYRVKGDINDVNVFNIFELKLFI